jgi:hypothetical protein
MSDDHSTFSYDGEGDPDSFSLAELQSAVDHYFLTSCRLEKLAEGGYHKVCLVYPWDRFVSEHRIRSTMSYDQMVRRLMLS